MVAVEALAFCFGLQLGFSPLCAFWDCGYGFLFLLGLPWFGCGCFSVFLVLTAALTAALTAGIDYGFDCGFDCGFHPSWASLVWLRLFLFAFLGLRRRLSSFLGFFGLLDLVAGFLLGALFFRRVGHGAEMR